MPGDSETAPSIGVLLLNLLKQQQHHQIDEGRVQQQRAVRNRRDRMSEVVSDNQVTTLIASAVHAERIGLPLASFRTIHWGAAGIESDADALQATARFIKLSGGWLRSSTLNALLRGCAREGSGKDSTCTC